MKMFLKKIKNFIYTPTNTLTFMLGVFVGMTIFNADFIVNTILTVMSGSAYHTAKVMINLV